MRELEVFICRCGDTTLGGPEEIVHFNQQCPGRRDPDLIERVALVPKGSAAAPVDPELVLV